MLLSQSHEVINGADLRCEVLDVGCGLFLASCDLAALASVDWIAGARVLLEDVTNLNLRH